MKIYRYEHKIDGGGPFLTRDGILRSNPNPKFQMNDPVLYGCNSLESLLEYFDRNPIDTKDFIIKIYNVPDKEIILIKEWGEVIFPKKEYDSFYLEDNIKGGIFNEYKQIL